MPKQFQTAEAQSHQRRSASGQTDRKEGRKCCKEGLINENLDRVVNLPFYFWFLGIVPLSSVDLLEKTKISKYSYSYFKAIESEEICRLDLNIWTET